MKVEKIGFVVKTFITEEYQAGDLYFIIDRQDKTLQDLQVRSRSLPESNIYFPKNMAKTRVKLLYNDIFRDEKPFLQDFYHNEDIYNQLRSGNIDVYNTIAVNHFRKTIVNYKQEPIERLITGCKFTIDPNRWEMTKLIEHLKTHDKVKSLLQTTDMKTKLVSLEMDVIFAEIPDPNLRIGDCVYSKGRIDRLGIEKFNVPL